MTPNSSPYRYSILSYIYRLKAPTPTSYIFLYSDSPSLDSGLDNYLDNTNKNNNIPYINHSKLKLTNKVQLNNGDEEYDNKRRKHKRLDERCKSTKAPT